MVTVEELEAKVATLEAQVATALEIAAHHALEHGDKGRDPYQQSEAQAHTHESTSSGNTLDQAYDQGGAGAGRQINVDDGAVLLKTTGTDSNAALEIERNAGTRRVLDTYSSNQTRVHPQFRLHLNGSMAWGAGGLNPTDIGLLRYSSSVLGLLTGDTFRVDTIAGVGTGGVTIGGVTIDDGLVDDVDVSSISTKPYRIFQAL